MDKENETRFASDKRKIQGVLFDMDGVLVDSEPVIIRAIMEVLKEQFGLTVKKEDFLEFTGMGEDRFIGGVVEKYGKKYELSMKKAAYERYAQIGKGLITVYPNVRSTVKTLCEKGLKIAVCSSADAEKVNINLDVCGVRPYVNGILTGCDVERKKPFPDIFIKGASIIGVPPENCIVVEDAISGIKAAKAAGAFAIGVTTSFKKEELLSAGANAIIDDISEMLPYVN